MLPYNPAVMAYYRSPYAGGGVTLAVPPFTPMIKKILWVLGGAFLLQSVLKFAAPDLERMLMLFLGINPELRFAPGSPPAGIWQLLTYGLLHGGLTHILFNGLGIWMFGGDVERVLGGRGMLRYFLVCIAGGGLAVVLAGLLFNQYAFVIGASGGVMGLVLAFAIFFPDRQVFIFPIPFPVKAWVMAVGYGLINLYGAFFPGASGVSYAAHLGGLAAGYIYLKGFIKPGGWTKIFARRRRYPFKVVQGDRPGPYDIH